MRTRTVALSFHQPPSTSPPSPPLYHRIMRPLPYPWANNKHLHSPLSKPFPQHNSTSSHADCQVLLLLGSHVPGPRHHLCPQRRQGMYVCVCVCACPPSALLRLFSCRTLFMAPAYFVPSAWVACAVWSVCPPDLARTAAAPAPRPPSLPPSRPPSRRRSTSSNRRQHHAFTLRQSSRGAELQHYVCVCEVPCRPI